MKKISILFILMIISSSCATKWFIVGKKDEKIDRKVVVQSNMMNGDTIKLYNAKGELFDELTKSSESVSFHMNGLMPGKLKKKNLTLTTQHPFYYPQTIEVKRKLRLGPVLGDLALTGLSAGILAPTIAIDLLNNNIWKINEDSKVVKIDLKFNNENFNNYVTDIKMGKVNLPNAKIFFSHYRDKLESQRFILEKMEFDSLKVNPSSSIANDFLIQYPQSKYSDSVRMIITQLKSIELKKIKEANLQFLKNWSTENLNVDTFRDGTIITQAKSISEWINLCEAKKPAWAYYNFSQDYKDCGKIYNLYAIEDSRGLAPAGYHIPSLTEWDNLVKLMNEKYSNESYGISSKPFIRPLDYYVSRNYTNHSSGATKWEWGGYYDQSQYWRLVTKYNEIRNDLDFRLMACGYFWDYVNPHFTGVGDMAAFWTTTKENEHYEIIFFNYVQREFDSSGYVGNWKFGAPVRVLKDLKTP